VLVPYWRGVVCVSPSLEGRGCTSPSLEGHGLCLSLTGGAWFVLVPHWRSGMGSHGILLFWLSIDVLTCYQINYFSVEITFSLYMN